MWNPSSESFSKSYPKFVQEEQDWDDPSLGGLNATPGILRKYVDGFVNLYKEGSSAENALNDSLKMIR